jgi:hypothetical protein
MATSTDLVLSTSTSHIWCTAKATGATPFLMFRVTACGGSHTHSHGAAFDNAPLLLERRPRPEMSGAVLRQLVVSQSTVSQSTAGPGLGALSRAC